MRSRLTPTEWRKVRAEMLDRTLSEIGLGQECWVWCLHCNRCYRNRNAAWSAKNSRFQCAYHGCDGGLLADGWHWPIIADANDYPSEPELNTIYPQYRRQTNEATIRTR